MSAFAQEQLDALKPLGAVSVLTDGGKEYVLVQQCAMPPGCAPARVDVLLCPHSRDGYPSRLFFAEKVNGRGAPNWHVQARIADRNWHAYSYKDVPASLPLVQMLMNHLRGLG
ncbi:MAG: hypothetical protein AB1938_29930 [Myxococcota bacterium]